MKWVTVGWLNAVFCICAGFISFHSLWNLADL